MTTNDTRTARERAEAAATEAGLTPDIVGGRGSAWIQEARGLFTAGFLARDAEPTTVSAEQIEAAAIAHYTGDKLDPGRDWRDVPDIYRWHMLAEMERSFRAAGFRIKGDEA